MKLVMVVTKLTGNEENDRAVVLQIRCTSSMQIRCA